MLSIVERKIADLKPTEYNPRQLSEKEYADIKASLERFGVVDPVIVNKHPDRLDKIVGGHQRCRVWADLGNQTIPTVEVSLTMEQERELLVRLNKNTGSWDYDVLSSYFELDELREWGFEEIDFAPGSEEPAKDGNTDPDDLPEYITDPTSEPGDLWVLGNHRLFCGDATSPEDVKSLLSGERPFMMVTDPPYGVQYDAKWREKYDQFKQYSTGKVTNDDRVDWTLAYQLFPGDVAYVWHAGLFCGDVMTHLRQANFQVRSQIIWVKHLAVFGRGAYHWQHEACFMAVKKGSKAYWTGDRKQTTVWEIANKNPMGGKKDDANTVHGTQKPVECIARAIRNHGKHGNGVYEPFTGSGTTIIACEQLLRRCFAMEIDPGYVDLAVVRWQNFTGEEAVCQATGLTYDEVRKKRAACSGKKPNKKVAKKT